MSNNTKKKSGVKIAPITVSTIARNGSVWNDMTTAYMKTAMKARGIPIPKTKALMIERIKEWAVTHQVRVSFTIG